MTPVNQTAIKRRFAAAEIGFVVFCVLIAEWAIIPFFGRSKKIGMIPVAAVLFVSFYSHRARKERARDLGFTADNFWSALRMLLFWMIPATALILATGWMLGSLHYNGPKKLSSIALSQFWLFWWGLLQQYALQAIVNRRAQEIWGRGWISILFAALIFSALHLPNVFLAGATLAAGILWAAVYQRAPNLFALAISHSLMTPMLICSISPALLHGMRVGYNYF
jgi:hypothetical protein